MIRIPSLILFGFCSKISSSPNIATRLAMSSSISTGEPWTLLTHKNPQQGWVPYNPRTMRKPPLDPQTKQFKILSYNVNGLKRLLELDENYLLHLANREDFDVLCLQETKLQVLVFSSYY